MQFKVPQFIDIEDKVFGPLTFKQFAYLAGGAGFGYLAFKLLPIYISIFLGPALVGFALALAFMKYNDKPFVNVVESFIRYYSRSRLYLWHKQEPAVGNNKKAADAKKLDSPILTLSNEDKERIRRISSTNRATMNGSNLSNLSWSLDVIGNQK